MVLFPKGAVGCGGRVIIAALFGGALPTLAGCEKPAVVRGDSAPWAAPMGADSNAAHILHSAQLSSAATPDVAIHRGAGGAIDRQGDGAVAVPVNDSHDAGDGFRVLRFPWRPPGAGAEAYAMDEAEDQHGILFPTRSLETALPVVIAFHGQPKRGQAPRTYGFLAKVTETAQGAMATDAVRPIVLVLPVFRYFGQNWPAFDVVAFEVEIEQHLAAAGVKSKGYYVVGHSGAAGCGGGGMNGVSRMKPAAVGFFDTCLGSGWREEVQRLRAAHVPTLLMHSLETAAFSPRQSAEYLSTFDFGRAYGPAGLAPSACPDELPKAKLRDQPFRCSSDRQGTTQGLIVDSGEGEEGHNALVPIALEYFLKRYVGPRAQ